MLPKGARSSMRIFLRIFVVVLCCLCLINENFREESEVLDFMHNRTKNGCCGTSIPTSRGNLLIQSSLEHLRHCPWSPNATFGEAYTVLSSKAIKIAFFVQWSRSRPHKRFVMLRPKKLSASCRFCIARWFRRNGERHAWTIALCSREHGFAHRISSNSV